MGSPDAAGRLEAQAGSKGLGGVLGWSRKEGRPVWLGPAAQAHPPIPNPPTSPPSTRQYALAVAAVAGVASYFIVDAWAAAKRKEGRVSRPGAGTGG